jgi:signal transduction histidine kinase
MDLTLDRPLAKTLAALLRAAHTELTARWLERISARVSLEANRVFPSDDLLDHVPLLIDGIADYLENLADEVAADAPVVAKARELGQLRYAQGFSAHEVLKEYEILGGIIFSFFTRTVDDLEEPCRKSELLHCAHRVYTALEVIRQATAAHFLELMTVRVREREERLARFNRMVSHELKTQLNAAMGARAMLREPWLHDADRTRFTTMLDANIEAMGTVLGNLEALSRLEHTKGRTAVAGQAHERHVLLQQAAGEAIRQLREFARSRLVVVRLAEDLPAIEVDAAVVELCLTNYISNAIKYSNAARLSRWVAVRARVVERSRGTSSDERGPTARRELIVEVRDNGIGVPEAARERLFERFYRAHVDTADSVEGTGLGLSLVRETVELRGGGAWAEFDAEGSCFAFSLPLDEERGLLPDKALATPEERRVFDAARLEATP